MTYTPRGGSYGVARANFGPRIAQIPLRRRCWIDYVVTVAVQVASARLSVVSLVTSAGPYTT